MSSTVFEADLQDISFALFEQHDVAGSLAGIAQYADYDNDLYETMLEEASRLATEVLHPINGPGDRQGVTLHEGGEVETPEGYREAWQTLAEGGWISPSAPPEVGGPGLPPVIGTAVSELFTGACMAFAMYPGLTAAAGRMIHRFAPPEMRAPWAEKLFTGQWAGTMCLTEADAGSSVGDNRCKALPGDEPGTYFLEGEKVFITGGDHDLTENIAHLILARTPEAPAGSRGLSLFLCPKHLVDDDLQPTERNGAVVVGIEEKMGIHGSSTCTLALGADRPCKAWLLGEEGQGLQLMFHMMNEARIGVGVQGMAIGAAAFQFARAYAKERIQGTSLEEMRDPEARRVPIVEHPDVRRMLMTLKVQVETMRSFCYRLALRATQAEHAADPEEKQRLQNVVDLLVPVVKAHCTDVGFDCTVTGVQVHGGYGYIGEYPVEQTLRDGKIMSIYEGTNGIQAMDLLGRKMRVDGGALFVQWTQEVQARIEAAAELGFEAQAEALGKAVNHLGATAMHLGGLGMQGDLEGAMLHATPFCRMFGTVQLGIEALDQAVAAKAAIDEGGETPFLAGKLLNLDFYVANLLPGAVALGKGIQSGDHSPMDERLFG